MIQVSKTFLPPLEEYEAYLEKIWQSGWVTNSGQFERELKEKLSAYLDVPHLEVVANGTLALQIAIKALDLKGEIITTPFTYVASPNSIAWEGCTPVFVDISEDTLCIDPALIEAAITEKTTAILATHVYGLPCDVEKIAAIAKKHQLKVIYDAAHCFGVRLHGQSILRYGDISTMSFHATKIFHSIEGGAVVCRDENVAKRAFLMKKFGHIGEDEYIEIGINAKMSEMHAAMGLCVLPKVKENIAKRKELVNLYDSLFEGKGLQRPVIPAQLEYNYAYYPVLFPTHEIMMGARTALQEENIFPRRYFYPSLNTLKLLTQTREQSCPVSERIASNVLCLPLFFSLHQDEVEKISNIIISTL